MIIGLTGGIGAGKTTVLAMFNEQGVPTCSADIISKEILDTDQHTFDTIVKHFGRDIINRNNSLDRKKLRDKIFNFPNEKKWLEDLLHPLIKQKISDFSKSTKYPYCVIEVPLLFEVKWQDLFDRILNIDCPEEIQLSRTMQRDNSSQEAALKIIQSQVSRQERVSDSDDLIENTGDLVELRKQVEQLHHKYLKLSSSTE